MNTNEDAPPPTNLERLRAHLDDASLAAELVDAFAAATPEDRATDLRIIANARLEDLKNSLDAEN